jgi:hypothetical protein
VSLQFRSKLATQTSQETEDEAESVDIDLEGEVAGGLEDGPAIGSDGPAVGSAPATATHSRPSLSPDVMPLLPVRPKRSAARAQADEDKLLATLEERGRQSMELQHKLINLIKPAKPANERETYGDWAKSVMVGLHPTVWRQFQAEQSALLARYLDLDDRARGTQAQQQTQQQFQQQTQQQSQQQSQCDPPWQPAPRNWPQSVANPTSLWNSQSTSWVQTAMHPGTSTVTTTTEPTANTSANTSQNAFSGLLGETSFSELWNREEQQHS